MPPVPVKPYGGVRSGGNGAGMGGGDSGGGG
jgi:hypothetical protein